MRKYTPILLAFLGSCSFFQDYQDDNLAEEAIESIIEGGTGVDVDLTPVSHEMTPIKRKWGPWSR